jgi:hypothetical protein
MSKKAIILCSENENKTKVEININHYLTLFFYLVSVCLWSWEVVSNTCYQLELKAKKTHLKILFIDKLILKICDFN